MPVETAEIVVVGGGVVGCSVAFHLVSHRPGLRVLLLERGTVASGATGRSTAIVRTHYVDRTEAHLAARSLHWFRHWPEAVGGHCGYRSVGFLMLVSPAQAGLMARTVPMLRELGAEVSLLRPEQLQDVEGRLSAEGVGAAAYEPQGGYADPAGTATALAEAAKGRGAEVRQHAEVRAITAAGGRVTGVQTAAGEIACGTVVVAAGAGSPVLLAPFELDLPLDIRLIRASAMERPDGSAVHPSVIDRTLDTHFRPDGNLTIFGIEPSVRVAAGPTEVPSVPDSVTREAALKPAERMPELAGASIQPGWAQFDCYTADGHPVVGAAPGVQGLYLAVGSSGTGFKTAPALGEALAGVVLQDRRPDHVPLEPLAASRFAAGRLLPSNYGH